MQEIESFFAPLVKRKQEWEIIYIYGKPGKIEFSKRPSSKEGKIQKQYICVIF